MSNSGAKRLSQMITAKELTLLLKCWVIYRVEENDNYLDLVLFSDESTFHICGKVNRHNCCIWGSENPHQVIGYERVTPKRIVWLGQHKHGVISPFFFMESTVTGHSYLDMLENFAIPQIPSGFIFQQDDTPPHFHRDVTMCIKFFLSYSIHCWKRKFNKAFRY
jgi:hypothetical protein